MRPLEVLLPVDGDKLTQLNTVKLLLEVTSKKFQLRTVGAIQSISTEIVSLKQAVLPLQIAASVELSKLNKILF